MMTLEAYWLARLVIEQVIIFGIMISAFMLFPSKLTEQSLSKQQNILPAVCEVNGLSLSARCEKSIKLLALGELGSNENIPVRVEEN